MVDSFNPRLRTGGDKPCRLPPRRRSSFNPRLRTGGDPNTVIYCWPEHGFQSTPPHGRRRASLQSLRAECQVSIHASAREATRERPRVLSIWLPFQSTPPHGRRRYPTRKIRRRRWVSIHASAREATLKRGPEKCPVCGFNPRLRTGGDAIPWICGANPVRFQSTPPHGRRPLCGCWAMPCWASFNPRLRTGGDSPLLPRLIRP